MPKYQVVRAEVINVPSEQVFQTIADFKTWKTWSPWLICEPEAKVVVTDNSNSVGSNYEWTGKLTGQGKIQHRTLVENTLIEDDLNFIKPFKSYADIRFQIAEHAAGCKVIWTMDSSMPWFLFWMIPMMKTFLGMDFARGLRMLKEWLETGEITSKSTVHGVQEVEQFRIAGIANSCAVDDVGASMEASFAKARSEFKRLGIPLDGQMVSVYTKFGMKSGTFDYISGYIIPENVSIPSDSSLKVWKTTSTKAFHVAHVGSYEHLGNGWSIANAHVRGHKLKQCRGGTYEVYRTVPPTPQSQLLTDIYLPLK